jgi:hypothetical protein
MSDLGQFAPYAPRTIKVTQAADSITISKTAPSMNGDDFTYSETLSYDGKETKTTFFGTSTRTASAKWSDDGQTLTISYDLMLDFNGQTTEIKGTEVWTLGDGGKTLVSQNNSSSSFGEMQAKGIYEKQSQLLNAIPEKFFLRDFLFAIRKENIAADNNMSFANC